MLRALGLGDLLTGVPALRALGRAFPDHELVLAAPSVLEPLARLAGCVDRLLPARGLEPLAWSGAPPAVAVNLHGRGPQSHAVLADVAPRRLVAFGNAAASHRGPRWDDGEHEVRRWCRLLEEALRVPTDVRDLGLAPPPVEPEAPGAVVLHPGAAFPSRRWPPERFAEVARWATAAGHRVVLTGGPDEAGLAEEVRRRAGLPQQAVLAGRTDLLELAAQVAAASLVVCGDTGVAHLATAFSTPSVLLFGPVPPALWGPPPDGPHRVLWHGTGRGDPFGAELDPALARIEVGEVVAAADALLALSPATRAPRRTTPGSA